MEKKKNISFEKEQIIEEDFKEENKDNETEIRKIFYDFAKKRREKKLQGIKLCKLLY